MRTLLMILMIAGMMSTVGVYAAGFGSTPTTKTLAGSGDEAVSAPNTGSVALGYVTTGDVVTGVKVTWTPSSAGDYDITVKAGGTTGTLNIPSSGTMARTDTVTISSTEASAITTAKVVISQN